MKQMLARNVVLILTLLIMIILTILCTRGAHGAGLGRVTMSQHTSRGSLAPLCDTTLLSAGAFSRIDPYPIDIMQRHIVGRQSAPSLKGILSCRLYSKH